MDQAQSINETYYLKQIIYLKDEISKLQKNFILKKLNNTKRQRNNK